MKVPQRKRSWKHISIISPKVKDLDSAERLSSYLGRKVFSKSGEYVGRVKNFLTKGTELLGMVVKGRQEVFIDKEYFSLGSTDMIMLSIEPVTNTIGKQVIDGDGRFLGRVHDLERKGYQNSYTALLVKRRVYSRPVRVPKTDISVSKKNVILKTAYGEEDNG